jgi:excinuclease ABC subunit C
MDAALREKIAQLPTTPGVYLMKDRSGRVIYVGKAVNLRDRLGAYLRGGDTRAFIPLLDQLLGDVETIPVRNEKEALLLENELVRRWKPRFNIKQLDGKNFVWLRLDAREPYPRLEVTRRVQDDGARYFGPYPLARALRETLRLVNRHFQLRTCSDHDPASHRGRPCVLCQIARFPVPSVYDIPPEVYRRHVDDAILFLEGKRDALVETLRERMQQAAREERFEDAARLRDQLEAVVRTLEPQKIVSAAPGEPGGAVLERLRKRLRLSRAPRRIECADVSHFHGGALVGALVAMADGEFDKNRYRRYRIASVAVGDDYASLYEMISRRLKRGLAEGDLPDLLVVDGGKGQLASAQAAMRDASVTGLDAIALAKRREIGAGAARRKTPERIFVAGRRDAIVLAQDSPELLLLARLRDEAHRFAIGYQRKLLRKERLRSRLEDIPGVGPKLRQALLRQFGSLERVRAAGPDELAAVQGVGTKRAGRIHAFLHADRGS